MEHRLRKRESSPPSAAQSLPSAAQFATVHGHIARWLAPAKRERRLGSFSLELGGTEDFGYSAHAACGASGASDQNIQELCATSLVACYGQREDSTRKHRRKSLIQFPPMMMLLIGMKTNFTVYTHYIAKTAFE